MTVVSISTPVSASASYQSRVVEELDELGIRLTKLRTFIKGAAFTKLDTAEQLRLKNQSTVMELYEDILEERVEAFS